MSSIRKAVITAAGRGTRHFPATRTVQKELFPLVDRDGITKPVIQIVVEEAVRAGVESVCIVCSPVSEGPIRAHFAPVSGDLLLSLASKPEGLAQAEQLNRLSQIVEFVQQPSPEGYGDAVLCARDFAGEDPFLLMLGDHLYLSPTSEPCAATVLQAFHRKNGPISGVIRTPEDQLHLFGVVSGERLEDTPPLYRVETMIEKPTPEAAQERLRTPGLPEDAYLSFFGMHALPSRVFHHLADHKAGNFRHGGEIQLTPALEALMRERPYFAVEVDGTRLDMGVPEGLVHTQASLALHSPFRETLIRTVDS